MRQNRGEGKTGRGDKKKRRQGEVKETGHGKEAMRGEGERRRGTRRAGRR